MRIDSIKNGIVIDHIAAGKAKEVYDALDLDKLDCQVAIIMNCRSNKMGKKDIIKIDNDFDVDLDVLGYIDPNITVSIIKNGVTVEKKKLQLPEKIINVAKCKNPRCITSVERDLDQVFYLANREKRIYRCYYCESKAEKKD
ncbi:aspartate carbamoyltransferase regulatory subunit [Catenibacterium mitsuokai]|uniref:aspartate carbamoyltransferase regulatory subunit n=1 Tax=Catenibacterium mitsuokai TaxID=100886 RepID=UPI0022E518A2|nr:aspartate carbamoyltransferase regulatory subunit [Catenibacterium mitsuokai]